MVKNCSTSGLKLTLIELLSHFYASYLHSNSHNKNQSIYYQKNLLNQKIIEFEKITEIYGYLRKQPIYRNKMASPCTYYNSTLIREDKLIKSIPTKGSSISIPSLAIF